MLFSQTLGTTNTREHPGAPEQTPGTDGKKESSMHGADLRWLVVFKRCRLTYPWKVIEEELHIPISSQKRIVACYEMTGQVFRRSVKKRGRPRALGTVQTLELIKRVLDSPKVTLAQHRAHLILISGKTVSVATLCQVLHENGLSVQRVLLACEHPLHMHRHALCHISSIRVPVLQVQHIARLRDEHKAQYFWLEIMTFYTADELLVADETAKAVTSSLQSQRFASTVSEKEKLSR